MIPVRYDLEMESEKEHKQRMYEKRQKRRTIRKLHDAIRSNDEATVRESIDGGIDIHFHYGGVTALQLAIPKGCQEICSLLLACPGDVDQSNVDNMSLLSLAVVNNQEEIVKTLLNKGADMDKANNNDDTPLHLAAQLGLSEIAATLISADCNINLYNGLRQSPLAVAVAAGQTAIVTLLIDAGADLDALDGERRTPLIVAAQLQYLDIVKLLIMGGCNINIQEQYGRTAVYFAAVSGFVEIVKELISAKADLNLRDTRGYSPLLDAIKAQHFDVVHLLIASGCDLDIYDNEYRQTAIHCAIRLATQYFGEAINQLSVVRALVEAKCSLNVRDWEGWTPIYQAASGHEIEVVQLLLKHGVQFDLVTKEGDTPLHGAVFGGNHEIMRMLIAAGCDVNKTNFKNELPLHKAIANRTDIRIIEQLVGAGTRVDVQEKDKGATPLFSAISNDYIQAADLVLKAGCDVNLSNFEGDTPLWVACDKGSEDMVSTLLKHRDIDVNAGLSHIPLHAAAVHGFESITQLLLAAGADVNKLSDLGVSALYLAVDSKHPKVARTLVYHGANPTAPHQMSPLQRKRCCRAYSDPHPHLELEPLCSAMRNDDFGCMKLILLATPRISGQTIRTLRDLMFRTQYAQDANLSDAVLAKHAAVFTTVLSTPRGLQLECRGVIRETLGSQLLANVQLLPLPSRLKDFILMHKELCMEPL